MGMVDDILIRWFVGILERPLLGGAMRATLFVVERRLSRTKDRADGSHGVAS